VRPDQAKESAMNPDRPNESSTLLLIRENRRLRELVVSLSATLLRNISREAAPMGAGGVDAKAGRRKAAGNGSRRAIQVGAEGVPVEG
jgi:hypothetical protein